MEPDATTAVQASLPRKVEATLGAFFCFVVVLAMTVGGAAMAYAASQNRATAQRWQLLAMVVPIIALEWLFAYQLKVALEDAHYPFAPWFALNRRRWPLLLRPVVAGWWAFHFLLGMATAVLAENLIVTGADTWDARLLRCVAFVAVGFTIAYSANLYALLAVACLGGGPRWVNRLWRGRVALDLCVATIAAVFPFLSRHAPAESPPTYPPTSRSQFIRQHPPRRPATGSTLPGVAGTPRP